MYLNVCSFTLCVNVEDETGAAAVVLSDREVHRMIGKNVYEVLKLPKEVYHSIQLQNVYNMM